MVKIVSDNYFKISNEIRKKILLTAYNAGSSSAHIGGALSTVDVLMQVYKNYICKNKNNKIILSKGHACLALYCVLAQFKKISVSDLKKFEKNGSYLLGHPVRNLLKGIEYSSGSLGMGLSYACGLALLELNKIKKSEIFVILGDGECNEGSVWEAAMTSAHYNLNNITAIIDNNGFQQTGKNSEILDTLSLEKKWKSFGWHVVKINGHNPVDIKKSLTLNTKKPKLILAKTIKGKGVKEFENNNYWHHSVLTKEKYKKVINDLND
jgi:transketolase